MSDVLAKICADKRQWIEARKQEHDLSDLKARANDLPAPRGFRAALAAKHAAGGKLNKGVSLHKGLHKGLHKDQHKGLHKGVSAGQPGTGGKALIAEIKKASPSKGLIRPDFHPADLAEAYELGGATCLSVLTDVPYFQGDDSYIGMARGAASLPVLRKDFMLDPYQIYESRALGADCILIIMACLDDDMAKELHDLAYDLRMDALVEVHDAEEMARANALCPKLLGVNNRNLKTLEISLTIFEELAPLAHKDALFVAESGLYAPEDLDRMAAAGAQAYLIGESLMRQNDVTAATKAILGATGG